MKNKQSSDKGEIMMRSHRKLRDVFYKVRHDRCLLSAFTRCRHECFEDVVATVLRRKLKIGTFIVVQRTYLRNNTIT